MAAGRKNYNRFEINGSKGSIAFDLERMNELEVYCRPRTRAASRASATSWSPIPTATRTSARWWPPGHIIGYEHTFTHTVYDLLEGDGEGQALRPNFEDGVRNQSRSKRSRRPPARGGRSARTRRWVTI